MPRRKFMGFWTGTAQLGIGLAILIFGLAFAMMTAIAEAPVAVKGDGGARNPGADAEARGATYLVREVVYNELHDHDMHGYWRYWIERHSSKETVVQDAVETPQGPVARLMRSNGGPVPEGMREEEDRRLQHLLTSPSEQAQHRKDYADDEKRIGRILALLPDAFLYDPAQPDARSQAMPDCPCVHLRFRPNPAYPAHSIESRIFHAMAGDLWISAQNKRMVRLDGKLQENVDFGYGILGRLYKDGWFRLERTHVEVGAATGAGDWKTQRLEVHMSGRAMFFKTVARETSEVRGGFKPVPAGLSLEQAAAMVREAGTNGGSGVTASIQPVSLTAVR